MDADPRQAREPGERRRDARAAWSAFLLLFGVYLATATGLPDVPDAEVEFQTARSLAREGGLALGDTPEARALIEARFGVARGIDGRWYSWYGLGQAAAALPLYALGAAAGGLFPEIERRHAGSFRFGAARSEYFAHLAVGLRNPLLAAATGALVLLCARRLGATRRSAWLAALAFGLCSFAWPQARSTSSDVQATFFAALAFHALLRARAGAGPSAALTAGAALGACLLTRIACAPLVAGLAAAGLLIREAPNRKVPNLVRYFPVRCFPVALLAPLVVCAALVLWANERRFGAPLETGYGAGLEARTFFSYPLHLGLAGLLLSPGKGLAWMAPPLLLLPWALGTARGRGERLWPAGTLVAALTVLAPIAATQTWHGAYTYGPRYALPLVPIAWSGLALALDGARPRLCIAWGALCALGLAVQVPAALVDHVTHEDLAAQAARFAWPDPGGASERERDEARFLLIQWDWRFAAPWAHWRILAHRARGRGERFPSSELFFLDQGPVLEPAQDRERGFAHLAWADLELRLGGSALPALILCAASLCAGAAAAWASLGREGGGAGP